MKTEARRGVRAIMVAATCAFLLAACGGSTTDQPTPNAKTPATGSPTTTVQGGITPTATNATPVVASSSAVSVVTSQTPGATVSVAITPKDVTVGGVTLDLSVEPARHMFDQSATVSIDSAQQQQQSSNNGNNPTPPVGSAVLGGGMLGVTNNLDPSQSAPADSSLAIVRHVVVHVKTKDGQQPVPYLNLSFDLLLDGHPILYDQSLEPMVAADQGSPQLYYGNNVKFPQRGSYQIFIRMQSNPLLGKAPPPAAQFDLRLS